MSESAPASGVIALGMVIGACLGLAATPLIVAGPEDIPAMNIVWFSPLAATFLMAIAFVRSDRPPTPPSKTAELQANEISMRYLEK